MGLDRLWWTPVNAPLMCIYGGGWVQYVGSTTAGYAYDLALLTNTPGQADSQLHSLEQAAGGIDLYVNTKKTDITCFKQGAISALSRKPLKLVNQFPYLGSNISSTKSYVNICTVNSWAAIDRLLIIWNSDLDDEIKQNFFQADSVSVILHGCTYWTLMKRIKK